MYPRALLGAISNRADTIVNTLNTTKVPTVEIMYIGRRPNLSMKNARIMLNSSPCVFIPPLMPSCVFGFVIPTASITYFK